MAEENQTQPKMKILSQFIRDLSFENIAAQKGMAEEVKPEIQVQVNLDAAKRADNQYEVVQKLKVEAKAADTPLFLLEIEYAGRFQVENIPENQLHPYLMIECPRMTFPYLRRIVSDITRDGGYPPLNLDNIDFMALYRNEIARRQAEQNAEGATVQ